MLTEALGPSGPPDNSDELAHHLLAVIVLDGVGHAALDVVLQEEERHLAGSAGHGGQLLDDVRAVAALFDHLGDTAGLTFDAAHPGQEDILVLAVQILVDVLRCLSHSFHPPVTRYQYKCRPSPCPEHSTQSTWWNFWSASEMGHLGY